jgi:hypothetical protein
MQKRDAGAMPRFYFALPRLIQKLRGGSAERTDSDWLEANAVGAIIHVIVYVFFARLLLSSLPMWQKLALLLPLALLVLLFWMLWFAILSVVINAAQRAGLLRAIPPSRVQGVLIGIITTAFACRFIFDSPWLRLVGWFWITAVSLNLLAACILAFSNGDRTAVP